MSMFALVFPDENRTERMGAMLALIANDASDKSAYCESIIQLRLRDMWVEKSPDGPPVLAVYTRNGGGNRECSCEGTPREHDCTGCRGEKATEHPAYLRDADDDFDSTYRTYWFAFPDSLPRQMKQVLTEVAQDPRDMSEVWHRAIDAIGSEA